MKECKHFGICGGCKFQDIPYSEQVKIKNNKVKDLMKSYEITALLKDVNIFDEWFYRNKMEFTFSEDEKGLICGFHRQDKKRQVVNLEECIISFRETGEILSAICLWAQSQGYRAYNKYQHNGFFRNLIIRQTKATKQTMIVLVTTEEKQINIEDLKKTILSIDCEYPVHSVYRIVNNSWSDAVVFEKKELIYGEKYIKEEISGLQFNIGPDTFFQVNPKGANALYTKITEYAQLTGNELVLDLYCGAGGIGMCLAEKAKFVWGIELSPEIVAAAVENASENAIKNITFIAQDVRKFLNTQTILPNNLDIVTVNPPRGGLSKKVIRAILRLLPRKLIYSSCNPDALCRDLKAFSENYEIKIIEPFDFFPHTKHLECLAILKRK